MGRRQRSWGAVAGAVIAVALGGVGTTVGGSTALARAEPSTTSTSTSTTSTSTSTTTTSTSTTSTSTSTTSTTLPLAGVPGRGATRQDPLTHVTVMPTFPPPPTTTTTTIPFVDPTILPANSGSGRRAVYSKSLQRVWLVDEDGTVVKTHRVSGRLTWNQPTPNNPANPVEPSFQYYDSSNVPAFYRVFSRSSYTCNIKKPYLCWRFMVRFTKGGDDGDNIGFHQIPVDTRTDTPVQTLSQLGQPLSGGCVRQAPADAEYVWNWAWMHTKVVVLA
jgi:hypothetical protein